MSGLAEQTRRRIASSGDHWMWTGHIGVHGYGLWGGWVPDQLPRNVAAHRLVWWLRYGSLPEHLHHECGIKACVNPDHLKATDLREHRDIHHPPKTYCVNGHEFTKRNTYIRRDNGARQCRACKNEREKVRWRAMSPERRAEEIAKSSERRRQKTRQL